ncbi:MAG TPA: SEFIR domain-containing protein [Puia sp.]|jgi:hypothetical protein|nr:SEFIR domain-containing protein [Puia sp.]
MAPKIFISYSWSSPEHEDWVLSLASRLTNDGIDVVLDKWSLKEGNDKYSFMESMVTSSEIHRVLIILDRRYAKKADERASGVGTETIIISPKIYSNTAQEKFIPIVAELDEAGQPFLPAYLEGRIYIDLSNPDSFETNYERLLRNIHNKPSHSKPPIGKIPEYLEDEPTAIFATSAIVRGMQSQIDKHPQRVNSLSRDFLNAYFAALMEFRLPKNSNDWGAAILSNLDKYIVLRDDYLRFISIASNDYLKLDSNIVIGIFEKIPSLFSPGDGGGSWTVAQFDNFRFICHELFLYTIEAVLRSQNFEMLADLFHQPYLVQDRFRGSNDPQTYEAFCFSINSINTSYNRASNQQYLNPQADLLIQRLPVSIKKDWFVEADLLCYYVGLLNERRWFPITYIYREGFRTDFQFFNKLVSKKYCELVLPVLGFQSTNELRQKIIEANDRQRQQPFGYSSRHSVAEIARIINPENIASSR